MVPAISRFCYSHNICVRRGELSARILRGSLEVRELSMSVVKRVLYKCFCLCCCFSKGLCSSLLSLTSVCSVSLLGSIKLCLLDFLCCCVWCGACGLCCGGFWGKAKRSVLTRFLFLAFLVVTVLVSAILLAPGVQKALEENAVSPHVYNIMFVYEAIHLQNVLCVDGNQTVNVPSYVVTIPMAVDSQNASLNCNQFIGYLAVYRVCIGVACFFFIMMISMLRVSNCKDKQVNFQNGFVFISLMILNFLTVFLLYYK